MANVIGKVQLTDVGACVRVTDWEIMRNKSGNVFYRATGLVDNSDNRVFEKDRIEIYDASGKLWIEGVVVYSPRRAMFLLANRYTGDVNQTPLGDLIDGKHFYVVCNS